mmetsp:Transcript_7153/g.23287  ORF Transcript_7153/g.23287 Transcript_7153/m.23287 type:complete len:117 (+) Transcript_7153:686-1036(+)
MLSAAPNGRRHVESASFFDALIDEAYSGTDDGWKQHLRPGDAEERRDEDEGGRVDIRVDVRMVDGRSARGTPRGFDTASEEAPRGLEASDLVSLQGKPSEPLFRIRDVEVTPPAGR